MQIQFSMATIKLKWLQEQTCPSPSIASFADFTLEIAEEKSLSLNSESEKDLFPRLSKTETYKSKKIFDWSRNGKGSQLVKWWRLTGCLEVCYWAAELKKGKAHLFANKRTLDNCWDLHVGLKNPFFLYLEGHLPSTWPGWLAASFIHRIEVIATIDRTICCYCSQFLINSQSLFTECKSE